MISSYKDKIVWITGASAGIGEALAIQFSELGAVCILSARNEKKLAEVQSKLIHPENHFIIPLDLSKVDLLPQKVEEAIVKFGKIDVLVNNGGVSQRANAIDTSIDVDRQLMEVNFFGTIALTKAALPYLRKSNGQIIVISSIAGKFGFYLRSSYSAAKHALNGFFESLALEEEKFGIRVSIVCPGKINTEISLNAINEKGERNNIMDHNQATGMPVEICARKIIQAASKNKLEILVGYREVKAVWLKRFFPRLFWRILRRQSPV